MRMLKETRTVIEYWKKNRDRNAGEIAKALGMEYVFVKNVISHNTPKKNNSKLIRISDARMVEMIAFVKKGYSIKEVAAMYGVKPPHLYYTFRRMGIRKEFKFDKIRKMLAAGFSATEIVRTVGCTRNLVYQVRHKCGTRKKRKKEKKEEEQPK